jgi:hypothetical protein
MNFYKKITEWNKDEWVIKQRALDQKLSKLTCYDTVSQYLLFIRENGRQQKESLQKGSLIDYPNTVDSIIKENDNIIQDLNNNMNSLNPCQSLKEWLIKKNLTAL